MRHYPEVPVSSLGAGVQGYVAPMPVFALWSAPRARSTAFFRSMLERGDLLALHEPFEGLMYFGDTEVEGRTFESPASLLAWLRAETHAVSVFLKETTDYRVREVVLADRRFLAEARHAFLIRRPEEIAASLYALEPDMRIEGIGLEALHELHAAVRDAEGHRPVVIDSDDLVARPEATMAAYCAAVELPFIPEALTWEPGERPEWRRSARWHADVSTSSGFEQRERRYTHTVESSEGPPLPLATREWLKPQVGQYAGTSLTRNAQRIGVVRAVVGGTRGMKGGALGVVVGAGPRGVGRGGAPGCVPLSAVMVVLVTDDVDVDELCFALWWVPPPEVKTSTKAMIPAARISAPRTIAAVQPVQHPPESVDCGSPPGSVPLGTTPVYRRRASAASAWLAQGRSGSCARLGRS